jgi:ribosomal protein S6
MNNDIENGAVSTEQELEAGNNESRIYELGFHIDPELPTEEVKKTYQSIKDAIASAGSIIADAEPLKIPLAYTVSRKDVSGRRDFNSAFFAWIAYEADTEGHAAVQLMANTEKRIIRFLDIKTTVEAAKHAAEMHELMLRTPEAPNEDEVSETELDAALKEAGA